VAEERTALAEESLRHSEEHFDKVARAVTDYAIFLLDQDGYITTWNSGAERIKGYTREEIIGRHFSCFYPEDAIQRRWPEHELDVARSTGRFEEEAWRLRKDGSRFWANVVITALRDDLGQIRGFAKVTRDLTERKQAEEKLRAAYIEMEARVRERTAELAESNASLRAEVAERTRLERDLRSTVDQLRESDRLKTEFLAMMSHELRNPLAPIRNAVQVLKMHPASDPALVRARTIIERQVQQMTHLVDDLLDLSRISRNTLQIRPTPTDVASLVHSAVETSRPFIDAVGHELSVSVPAVPIVLNVDPLRISQVLSNLLNNAAKFTPRGGRISLTVEQTPSSVVFRVRDSGIGIPRDKLTAIFDMFSQLAPGDDRAQTGLGIGLTLAKRLVEKHGGTIEASSPGPGQGSEFIVSLPPMVEAVMRLPAASDHELPAPVYHRRVLIVDDNSDAAEMLGLMLSYLGCEVRLAYNGLDALILARDFRPDLIILDIGLPGLNGYEVASRLRAEEWGRDIVLIALTGWGQDEDKRRAREAGFDHHLVKPVNPEVLETILAEKEPM
jgi:PAS domain S-box-containing protein